jgi:hypothetical protein
MRSTSVLLTVLIAGLAVPGLGQSKPEPCTDNNRGVCAYQKLLKDLLAARNKDQAAQETALRNLVKPEAIPGYLVIALSEGSAFDSAVDAWERARVDKQVGTSAKGTGTTDLASRPSTPDLLGLGIQLGALTQTVSGSTATFNANAYGAYQAILGRPSICLVCAPSAWKNLNFGVSFDLSRQAAKQVATTGPANSTTPALDQVLLPQSSRQLSSVTVRYDIYNPLDPRSKEFKAAWSQAFKSHANELVEAARNLNTALIPILNPLIKDPNLQKLEDKYSALFDTDAKANNLVQLNVDFEAYFSELNTLAHNDIPDLDKEVSAAAAAFARYSQVNYYAVQEAQGKPQFTAEYVFNHPGTQPDTHDFKLIFGITPKSTTGALFTLNLAASVYGGSIPVGSKYGRLRDFQFAAQLDRPLGNIMTHPATFTLAGYVQYQFDPSVLNIGPGNLVPGTGITLPGDAQVLLGTKGTLGIVQAKITINTKSGVNIPVGISWANKTDLLNATDVRGHIGITYDFDSIGQIFGR